MIIKILLKPYHETSKFRNNCYFLKSLGFLVKKEGLNQPFFPARRPLFARKGVL